MAKQGWLDDGPRFPKVTIIMVVFIAALCLALTTLCKAQEPAPFNPPAGSILISKHIDPRLNTTPFSDWNHLATCVGDGWVVESQAGYGVIRTPLKDYMARPYIVTSLTPCNPEVRARVVAIANSHVGRPYRPYSSLAPRLFVPIVPWAFGRDPYGANCVTETADQLVGAGWPWFRGMRVPDDIFRYQSMFMPYIPVKPIPVQVLPIPSEGSQ